MMSKSAVAAVAFSGILAAQNAGRTKPPETPPIPAYKLPSIHETRLPNGFTVVLVEDNRFPLVTARLGFHAGSKYDPKPSPGLAESVAALLTEGTKTRSSRQIAEELASIGGALTGVASADGLTLAGSSLAEHAPKLLEMLADVARNATFPEEEVQLHKKNRKQSLLAQRAEPDFLADEKLNEVIYGPHPYSRIAPTMEALDRLDVKALATFRDTYLAPNNAFLILLGRIPPRAEALKLATERFGSWQKKDVPASPLPQPPESARQMHVIDRPGSVQADIQIGRLAVTRAHQDYFPLVVGAMILGQGPASRMFNNIREKHGFAYDAHSELDAKKELGTFTAVTQVRNEVIEPAMKALLEELEGMAKQPASAEELSNAQNFASGLYVLSLETQEGLAGQLSMLKILGLPYEYLENYTKRIRAVEPAQITAVAKKYILPDKAAMVVVGDAAKIGKALEKLGKVTITKAE